MEIHVMWLKAFAFFPWICGLVLDPVPLEECEVREMRHYLCNVFVLQHEIPGISSGPVSYCKQNVEYAT